MGAAEPEEDAQGVKALSPLFVERRNIPQDAVAPLQQHHEIRQRIVSRFLADRDGPQRLSIVVRDEAVLHKKTARLLDGPLIVPFEHRRARGVGSRAGADRAEPLQRLDVVAGERRAFRSLLDGVAADVPVPKPVRIAFEEPTALVLSRNMVGERGRRRADRRRAKGAGDGAIVDAPRRASLEGRRAELREVGLEEAGNVPWIFRGDRRDAAGRMSEDDAFPPARHDVIGREIEIVRRDLIRDVEDEPMAAIPHSGVPQVGV